MSATSHSTPAPETPCLQRQPVPLFRGLLLACLLLSCLLLAATTVFATGCCRKTCAGGTPSAPTAPTAAPENVMKAKIAQFSPTPLDFDEQGLSPSERKLLRKLVEAADYIHQIYHIQVWRQNPMARDEIAAQGPALASILDYFDIMVGPWDRLDHGRPFYGSTAKPAGAGYYPEDMTKQEFEAHLRANPADKAAFESYFTAIRRDAAGKLIAVPYSQEYRALLEPAARLLVEAAELSENQSLRRFLTTRAAAFSSNDYLESDMAWMDVKHSAIEVTIGPYETYEDELFGYKAAFEAFITLRDAAEGARLEKIAGYLGELQQNLPLDARYKAEARGSDSPMLVVNEVYTGGDARRGVTTAAFNLPNDERVRTAKGSKKVMLKNVMRAKYDKCWIPIMQTLLAPDQAPLVSFEAYFTDVVMHEVSHALGPAFVEVGGQRVEVSRGLKELYSVIEEAKADIVGLLSSQWLIDHGVLAKEMEKAIYAAYLGGIYRSIRFGATEAHGRNKLLNLNYLREKGAILYDQTSGHYQVDFASMRGAVRELAGELLLLEATANYDGAKAMLDKYGRLTPEIERSIAQVAHVPVDLRPQFVILEKMKAW